MTPPAAPQNVSAVAGVENVVVSWSPVQGADTYNIYWSSGPGARATGSRLAGASTPRTVGGLTFGVTYYFVVTAVAGQTNEGAESAEVSAFVLHPQRAGSDIEQYFDGSYNAASAAAGRENYDDLSRHPLAGGTAAATLLWGGTEGENCLDCHGGKSKSGGARHYSNECLKCHFENQAGSASLDVARHGNGVVELATVNGNDAPVSPFTIASIQDYDAWCLQCHAGTGVTLGGVAPSGKTAIDPAVVANGRHRLLNIGCIYCHHPHGRTNTRLVRENPDNRRARMPRPGPFVYGVYPNDTTGNYGYAVPNQSIDYRSRVDNNCADAADANNYCNLACHIARLDEMTRKDKVVLRDGVTGNYLLLPSGDKIYVVNGVQYSNDNINNLLARPHQHPNGEIIPTDDMVRYYAQMANISGPSYYRYPGAGDAAPMSYTNGASPLPFYPDFADGSRDFTNAYNNIGAPVKYRFTCSTCHNPHGTALPNTYQTDPGYPDLRELRANPFNLCVQCHR